VRRMIRPLDAWRSERQIGQKAVGLRALQRLGYDIPKTFVCSPGAYDAHCRGRRDVLRGLKDELRRALDPRCLYAVRSSSDLEDGTEWSAAGQFQSVVHIRGIDRLIDAIREVWASADGARIEDYRRGVHARSRRPRMAVLLQEMVAAEASGISFSRNPVTGADEVVVEAVTGTSERLTQGEVTPHRWVLGSLSSSTEVEAPGVPQSVIRQVAGDTREIARRVGYPVDLEWAYDGDRVVWLQLRPITALAGLPVYSNRISREYLPGLIKPLVWSINVPMINGAWVDLFQELVGPLEIDPMTLAKRFCDRAYFNMSGMGELFVKLGLPENTLEILLGLAPNVAGKIFRTRWQLVRHIPRAVVFLYDKVFFRRRIERLCPVVLSQFAESGARLAQVSNDDEIIRTIDELLPAMRRTAYARIVSSLIHFVMSRRLDRLAKRHGLDTLPTLLPDPRLLALDPAPALAPIGEALERLPNELRQSAGSGPYASFVRAPGTEYVRDAVSGFLERYGHLSDSGNDFSFETWAENPQRVLRLAIAHGARDRTEPARSGESTSVPRAVRRLRQRTVERRIDRETVGDLFSRGYQVLRQAFLLLGERWEACGWIAQRDDVFFLEWREIRSVVDASLSPSEAKERIAKRQRGMVQAASIQLPDLILGDHVPTVHEPVHEPGVLHGIPVSRGLYEGPVRVLRTTDESEKLRKGDVLVIPYSDVAWTPLFASAGAIVSEAGGSLSHSAIVARELQIPAVVSVNRACHLPDGVRVVVDAYEGTVRRADPTEASGGSA